MAYPRRCPLCVAGPGAGPGADLGTPRCVPRRPARPAPDAPRPRRPRPAANSEAIPLLSSRGLRLPGNRTTDRIRGRPSSAFLLKAVGKT